MFNSVYLETRTIVARANPSLEFSSQLVYTLWYLRQPKAAYLLTQFGFTSFEVFAAADLDVLLSAVEYTQGVLRQHGQKQHLIRLHTQNLPQLLVSILTTKLCILKIATAAENLLVNCRPGNVEDVIFVAKFLRANFTSSEKKNTKFSEVLVECLSRFQDNGISLPMNVIKDMLSNPGIFRKLRVLLFRASEVKLKSSIVSTMTTLLLCASILSFACAPLTWTCRKSTSRS
jgi:hypothetical protein